MPYSVREIFDSYKVDETESQCKVEREWIVEDPALAVANGPQLALKNGAGLPVVEEELLVETASRIWTVNAKTIESSRYGPTSVKVKVDYESVSASDYEEPSNESWRSRSLNVPWDEQMDITSSEEVRKNDLDGKTVGWKGEGAKVWIPAMKWTFKVNMELVGDANALWLHVGKCNASAFPNITLSQSRPFKFNAKTLLFLGASPAQHTNKVVYIPAKLWVWTCTLQFAFNRFGWENQLWTPRWDGIDWPIEPGSDWGYIDAKNQWTPWTAKQKATATVPILKLISLGPPIVADPIYSARVIETTNFDTIFPFDWNT